MPGTQMSALLIKPLELATSDPLDETRTSQGTWRGRSLASLNFSLSMSRLECFSGFQPRVAMRLLWLTAVLLLLNARADDFEFFEKKIRPVLVERYYQCHSAESEKIKGGLLKGGESGKPACNGLFGDRKTRPFRGLKTPTGPSRPLTLSFWPGSKKRASPPRRRRTSARSFAAPRLI